VGKTILDEIDMLTLYAYSDVAEATGRATWRGFLSFVISNVLGVESETSDELVSASMLKSPEELIAQHTSATVQAMHMVSAELASSLQMPLEYGLAALLDFSPPTKVTPIGRSKEQLTENELIALWLNAYQNRLQDAAFQSLVESWREMLEMALAEEMTAEDGEFPNELTEEAEQKQTKRRKKRAN
jgi:hypothetical protein